MAVINVLSDIPKAGNKLEKTSNPTEKEGLDSSNNAVTVFAALLSGAMDLNADPKGQNSKVGEDLGERESVNQPVLNIQNIQNFFALPFPTQLILQSDLPAGKEANSGNVTSQGKLADYNPSLDGLGEVSLSSGEISVPTGMLMSKSQGYNPGIAELDKYRKVIAEFLVALSGEITNPSLKGVPLSSESLGTEENSQDMAKILQGWMTVTDEVANNVMQVTYGQAIEDVEEIPKALLEGGATMTKSSGHNTFDFLEALSGDSVAPAPMGNPISLKESEVKDLRQDLGKILQGWMTVTEEVATLLTNKVVQTTDGQTKESVEMPEALQAGGTTTANSPFANAIKFLHALSGEDSAPAPVGSMISSEKTGITDLRQALAKILQAWMALADDGAQEGSISIKQKGIQPLLDILTSSGVGSTDPVLNVKASSLLAALNPMPRQEGKDQKTTQGVNEGLETEGGIFYPLSKRSSKLHAQQKLDTIGTEENFATKNFPRAFGEEVQKGDSRQANEVSGGKDSKDQNLSAGIGGASTLVGANIADGKTSAIPVWEQISTVLREHIKNRSQDLKQLDIQLHPQDLGKIQINLRWENGQLHLQVHASEAATGQILQNQLSDLRQTLTSQGVNCGMLEMGQGRERQQNPQENESQRPTNQNSHLDEEEELIQVPHSLAPGQPGVNQINVIA